MTLMEGGVGFGHGILEKTGHLLRPAPLLTPLDWFRSTTTSFSHSTNHARARKRGRCDSPVASLGGVAQDVIANPGQYGPMSGLDERKFVDSLFAKRGEESAVLTRAVSNKICEKSLTGKKVGGEAGPSVVKGQWTPEEDRLLVKLVKQHGVRKWSQIAKSLVGRIGKQCRERWHNHLRPDIKKETWSEEEERLLVEAHEKVGNKWAEIAKIIPGRTENAIKNHWNATKRRQNSRRKGRKTTNPKGKPQPSILQDYIRSMIISSKGEEASMSATPDSTNSSSTPHMTHFTQPALVNVHTSSPTCMNLDTSTHDSQFHTYDIRLISASAESSIGSSREEERFQLELIERALLCDDYILDDHQFMDTGDLAYFAPSPVVTYDNDDSGLNKSANTTNASSSPSAVYMPTTRFLHCDQYISSLLGGTSSEAIDDGDRTELDMLLKQEPHSPPYCKKEMDLMEMISSVDDPLGKK